MIRIVVADDHAIFRDGLCQLLALESDFAVVAQAEDEFQTQQTLAQHAPDVLLLGLKMAALGPATTQQIQAARGRTRVIVLTVSDDKNEFVQAMKLGVCAILAKQTAPEQLFQHIRTARADETCFDSNTTAAVIRRLMGPGRAPARSRLGLREREVVALAAQGFKNREIACKMILSEQTVKNHLRAIFDKVGVSNRLELTLYAAAEFAGDAAVADVPAQGRPRPAHLPDQGIAGRVAPDLVAQDHTHE